MIGDLVHLYVNNEGITNDDVKVVALSEDSITILNKFGIDEEYSEDDAVDGVSAITPIFLTEDMLIDNGFVLKRNIFGLVWWREEWVFKCSENKIIYITDGNGHSKNVIYVHELQRILRCCGLFDLADNFKLE